MEKMVEILVECVALVRYELIPSLPSIAETRVRWGVCVDTGHGSRVCGLHPYTTRTLLQNS